MGFGGDQWGSATAAAGDPRPPAIRAVAGQLRLRLAVAHEIAKDPSGTVRAASAPGNESKTAAFSSACGLRVEPAEELQGSKASGQ